MTDRVVTPEVFTADYVGEPGQRTFYIQVRGPEGSSSFLAEKGQVQALAQSAGELLVLIDEADEVRGAPPERDPMLGLEEPLEPEWRVGSIALGYEEGSDVVVVSLESFVDSDQPDVEPSDAEEQVQILLTRPQIRAFVRHALAVVTEGRPLCRLCGLPLEPGHICPASNGHRLGTSG